MFAKKMLVPDGTGVVSNGDVSPRQVGDSYSIRYHHTSKPGSLVTISYYVIEGDPGTYHVERQWEWMVCRDRRDPGGTEIWSDYTEDIVEYGIRGKRNAERAARRYAEADRAGEVTWSGEIER